MLPPLWQLRPPTDPAPDAPEVAVAEFDSPQFTDPPPYSAIVVASFRVPPVATVAVSGTSETMPGVTVTTAVTE